MTKIRVLVVDDHPLLCEGLVALIEGQPDMEVVGEAGDGRAAVDAAAALQPDLVIMDLSMPELSGAEATRRILAACPGVRVVALTGHLDPTHLQAALAAGVAGYVLKRSASDDVLRAAREALRGGLYLDPRVAADAVADGHSVRYSATTLSRRESEVLRMIAEGHAVKDIAAKLDISTRTLETYRVRAMEKLNLRSRVDIVDFAVQQGWLGPK